MIIYKRNIEKKLLSLRIFFFVLATICLLAFKFQNINLGYFISVVFITIGIIVIKDFIVTENSFQISKYYFFGLIKCKWEFNRKANLNITSYYSNYGQDDDMPNFDDSKGSGLGCLLNIFYIFKPSKIVNKHFTIEVLDETETRIKSVNITLQKNEFNFVSKYYNKNQS